MLPKGRNGADTTCGTSNGDLVKRTDPVGDVTCYAYDSLHRLTSVTYPNGSYSASTPAKKFVYDAATVNGGKLLKVSGSEVRIRTYNSSVNTRMSHNYSLF